MRVEQIERSEQLVIGVEEVVPASEMSEFFGRAFGAAAAGIAREGVEITGPAVALYLGPMTDTVDIVAGFPVHAPATPGPGLVAGVLPGGPVVEAIHQGPYDTLDSTYADVLSWFAEHHLQPASQMWEEYLVGPDTENDPSRWQTRIVYPLDLTGGADDDQQAS